MKTYNNGHSICNSTKIEKQSRVQQVTDVNSIY